MAEAAAQVPIVVVLEGAGAYPPLEVLILKKVTVVMELVLVLEAWLAAVIVKGNRAAMEVTAAAAVAAAAQEQEHTVIEAAAVAARLHSLRV